MTLPAGTRLGAYEIIAQLGAGGMGEVYRARDSRLDRDVAIKVLSSHRAGDGSAAARLSREAKAVAAVSHPNVLGIFDIGEHDGVPFVVTELLEGTTLRVPMAEGAMPPERALKHALQIAGGLAAAHDKGLVHRDLKPENIFVTADGRLKILDFGLARQAAPQSADETRLDPDTNPGLVVGTAGYMSPEQARGQAVDHRSDIFAFGAILFEMLGGRRAFRGDTMADTMASIVRDEPADLQQLNGAVSPALARIVARCLAKSPAERFHSTHDLALALEALSGVGSGTSAQAAPAAPAEKGLVVLPFRNMSADADNEFFADGLTEEIISDLSKIHSLRVISRTSAMQLKGREGNLPSIVRELRVQYVLEGSVRRAGDKLRITAQLVDATTDTQLWSDKYNGTMEDVFDIQERVARSIAEALRVKLTPEESREIAKRPIDDAAAFEAYLRARSGLMTFTEAGLRSGLQEIQRGLARLPGNALLLSVKGDLTWQIYNLGVGTPADLDEVVAIAMRIEAIEPGSLHADRLRGLHALHSGRLAETLARMKRVSAADPSDMFVHSVLSMAAAFLDQTGLARVHAERMVEIDPLSALNVGLVGWVDYMEGKFERGAQLLGEAYDRERDSPALSFLYTLSLVAVGRIAQALTVVDTIRAVAPQDKVTWFSEALGMAVRGEGEALAASVTPERKAWASTDPHFAMTVAQAFALAGRADEAFQWLDRLLASGGAPYRFLAEYDPCMSRLRDDPRWPALMERLKRTAEQAAL